MSLITRNICAVRGKIYIFPNELSDISELLALITQSIECSMLYHLNVCSLKNSSRSTLVLLFRRPTLQLLETVHVSSKEYQEVAMLSSMEIGKIMIGYEVSKIDMLLKCCSQDTGYTCHQLGSGAIVVQLSQPYMIDSMRLLLWDIDNRTYSYYIEVSTDQINWHQVLDKRNEMCKSWQHINFPKRPVVFIRIVGTYNTANEVFHCVHFECPAQVPVASHVSTAKKMDDDRDVNRRNKEQLSAIEEEKAED